MSVENELVMHNVCCKEFQGWCRAFTPSEVILSVLQAVLLTFFVAFLTFLLLHLVACSQSENGIIQPDPLTAETLDPAEWFPTQELTVTLTGTSELVSEKYNNSSTVTTDVACTWTPSAQTEVFTQYFEHVGNPMSNADISVMPTVTPPLYKESLHTASHVDDAFNNDPFDGEPIDKEISIIMALVKMRPPDDITYGCILTIISEFWTLTAASCIESIEEVDSLDSFVILEKFGESKHGRTHPVTDVLVHPKYQGTDKTYDIVALKSEGRLTSEDMLVKLPMTLDYLSVVVGESLTILGFGKFRSIDRDAFARGAQAVTVHVLPSAQCAARTDTWSARHLTGGAQVARGACGAAPVCAGPLHARTTPCNYCAGTPLLRARVLLGLMSETGPCGAPCEPVLYVNLATSSDWLISVLHEN